MGIRIDRLAAEIVDAYDYNSNGRVDRLSESTRTTVAVYHDGFTGQPGDPWGGFPRWTRVTTVYGRDHLFQAADADKDLTASAPEVADQIRLFDSNLDGQLNRAEHKAFQKAFGERVLSRVVDRF